MRHHAGWLSAVAGIAGIVLFVIGWFVGWDTIEPIEIEGFPLTSGTEAGTGAFSGVIITPWEWQTSWLTWATGLVAIGGAVVLVRFPSARRAIVGSVLVLLGLWMGWGCLSWQLESPDEELGFGISPWSLGATSLGAALTLAAGAVLLSGLRRRRSPPPPVSQER